MCESEAPQLQKLSSPQLSEILASHQDWISTEHRQGKQADLSDIDLTGTDLRGADLRELNLTRTEFRNANLQDADLRKSRGLLAHQLAGANLSGTKLPGEISTSEALGQVAELSKMLKTIFVSMLVGCLYSWLTIMSTKDAVLLTNSGSSPLPIIQTPISISGFYGVAPWLLLALFAYFQVYIARLWRHLASLPVVFSDGKPLDEKAYPWLLNSLVRAYVPQLSIDRPPLSRLEVAISKVLAWWVVPFTVALFWLFSLQKHDLYLTSRLIICTAVAVGSAAYFSRLAKLILRGQVKNRLSLKNNWMRIAAYKSIVRTSWPSLTMGVVVAVFGSIVSDGAFNGASIRDGMACQINADGIAAGKEKQTEEYIQSIKTWHRRIVPRFLPVLNARANADLTEEIISHKPPNWFLKPDIPITEIVQGAQLKNADLRRASAQRAFLVKADLRDAFLDDADLRGAQLQGADLRGTQLQGADLRGAQLQGADLTDAKLWCSKLNRTQFEGAYLSEASLQGIELEDTNLQKAILRGAHLQGAEIRYVELQGADLRGAQLQCLKQKQLPLQGTNSTADVQCKNSFLEGAKLQGAILHGTNLRKATLYGVKLGDAILEKAELQEAELRETDLQGAHLRGAQLQGAMMWEVNLQGADLSEVDLQCFEQERPARQGANQTTDVPCKITHVQESKLHEANLKAAKLQKADLRGTDLHGANLERAQLQGTNLEFATGLTQAQINSACIDSTTTLPPGILRPKPCDRLSPN